MRDNITAWILIVTALVWLFWDLYVWYKGDKTISEYINEWAGKIPVQFIFGVLCGHWFWPL